jgi:glycosyltransferase involved in cell wall biosynthesis
MTELKDISLILFFTRGMSLNSWATGGLIDRELLIYKRLAEELARVSLVTYGGPEELKHLDRLGNLWLYYNRRKMHPRIYPWFMGRFLGLPIQGPAVFKSNQLPGAEVGLKVAARHKKPFIARCGYPYSLNVEAAQGKDSAQAQKARRLEGWVFKRADCIVVTTEYIKERMMERHGLEAASIKVLPNFVDEEAFKPMDAVIKPGCLGFVGRLSPEKNLDAVIRALAGSDLQLEVVGEGPCKVEWQALAEERKARVRFLAGCPTPNCPSL